MSDYEYLVSICQDLFKPLPMTQADKEEVLQAEWEFHQMMEAEAKDWPPYDITLEL